MTRDEDIVGPLHRRETPRDRLLADIAAPMRSCGPGDQGALDRIAAVDRLMRERNLAPPRSRRCRLRLPVGFAARFAIAAGLVAGIGLSTWQLASLSDSAGDAPATEPSVRAAAPETARAATTSAYATPMRPTPVSPGERPASEPRRDVVTIGPGPATTSAARAARRATPPTLVAVHPPAPEPNQETPETPRASVPAASTPTAPPEQPAVRSFEPLAPENLAVAVATGVPTDRSGVVPDAPAESTGAPSDVANHPAEGNAPTTVASAPDPAPAEPDPSRETSAERAGPPSLLSLAPPFELASPTHGRLDELRAQQARNVGDVLPPLPYRAGGGCPERERMAAALEDESVSPPPELDPGCRVRDRDY